ncbi:uncharacterized protein LOC118732670 [Rhagoletis pomonella]|uniref:uncharacterized protein LOC118732670 n=1 Tax=Rhagoletis pomonella TaxID=28610 RepID=UPI001784C035|nr:uncharacterized protein LOC118732670 [Rhagoletis pomonella]
MLYGTTLRLPGEYFIDEEKGPQAQCFVENFREFMRTVRSAPTAHHTKSRAFTHRTLSTSTHVFIRVDEMKKPLEPPYRGPYEVLERISDLVFRVNVEGRSTTISTERLKPAFIENTTESPPTKQNNESNASPAPTTSSNRLPRNPRTHKRKQRNQ